MPLANPERDWIRHTPVPPLARDEVERRIGPTDEPLTLMSGGLANRNVRVGDERVLRIHRDPSLIAKEAALLAQPWQMLRTPRVLATGADFLLLEYVAHEPLEATPAHGAAVGRALAEIHARRYAAVGFLDGNLALTRVFPEEGFSIRGYGRAQLHDAEPLLDAALGARILAFLDAHDAAVADAIDGSVLCHCDFKVSNLHWAGDRPLVLDWEFAWSGPRLLDIGQLLRWNPPPAFVDAFAAAYRAAGGLLVDGWARYAEAIDLGNLIGLVARVPVAVPALLARIEQTLAAAAP